MKSRFLLAITLMATLTACVAPIAVPAPDYPNKEKAYGDKYRIHLTVGAELDL